MPRVGLGAAGEGTVPHALLVWNKADATLSRQVRRNLHVSRAGPSRRAVCGQGARVGHAGANTAEHGKAALAGAVPLRNAGHRHAL